MKKWAIFAAGAALLMATVPVFAAKGPTGQAGNSNNAHLYLHEKGGFTCSIGDVVGVDCWYIVEHGAWGKMNYNLSGSTLDYVFNGHGLLPDEDYTLIYYPDPWPGNNLLCLGSGVSNHGGQVHIMDSADTGDLPTAADDNYPEGAKIWLVLSDDVRCSGDGGPRMIGWTPAEYLFEYALITFDDTD